MTAQPATLAEMIRDNPSLVLERLSPRHVNAASASELETLSRSLEAWLLTQSKASEALGVIAQRDHRIATWCAAAIVRTVLYVLPDAETARAALRTAEQYVAGRASVDDCMRAGSAAYAGQDALTGSQRDALLAASLVALVPVYERTFGAEQSSQIVAWAVIAAASAAVDSRHVPHSLCAYLGIAAAHMLPALLCSAGKF